jgi:alkylation response protein AidB-like acyl-CoA dehydrogenase
MSTFATPVDHELQRAATRDRLLAAVERVRPILEANADEAERQRTLPEPSWRALHDEGLFTLKAPRELGGLEADPLTQIDVYEAVCRIDTSAGWALIIGAGSLALTAPWVSDAGLQKLMSRGRLPRMVGVAMPGGQAVPVPGGYRVTGRWPFASGCHHAEWLFGAAVIAGSDPPRVQAMLFPAEAVTLLDTWHVGGLKGTGSDDFVVQDAFVPEDLSFALLNAIQLRGSPLFRLGTIGLLATEHGAFALGTARRALEEMRDLAQSKRRGLSQQGVAGRSMFQFDLGYCEQALNAARANLVDAYRRAWQRVLDTGETSPAEVQIELRSAAVFATDVAVDVTRRMFRHAGARALYSGNVIERCSRDMQAASQHYVMSQSTYELRGKALLSFEGLQPLD